MSSLNIRLTPEDVRALEVLRQNNVNVSELVREAIHSASFRQKEQQAVWTSERIDKLFESLDQVEGPEPEWVQQGVNLRDRKAMSKYVRRKAGKRAGKLADLK